MKTGRILVWLKENKHFSCNKKGLKYTWGLNTASYQQTVKHRVKRTENDTLVQHHEAQTDIIFGTEPQVQSRVYMATFRPFTLTWGALMKSSKCQTIREPRSPSRPMTPQCHQVLVAERQTSGPRSVEASEKRSANRIMATRCDFVGFVAQSEGGTHGVTASDWQRDSKQDKFSSKWA